MLPTTVSPWCTTVLLRRCHESRLGFGDGEGDGSDVVWYREGLGRKARKRGAMQVGSGRERIFLTSAENFDRVGFRGEWGGVGAAP